MEKAELLVELGAEEIPASVLESAANQFADALVSLLGEQRLSSGQRTVWYTPRRLVVGIQDIPTRQEDLSETITGPPKSVAFGPDGNPTKAALAFAQKLGVPLSRMKISQTPKGEYLTCVRRLGGQRTAQLLQELVPAAIARIKFPKTMYWSRDRFRFARPLRWILAIYRNRVLKFRIGDIVSSRFTAGHRFIGRPRLTATSLDSLREVLRANGVLVDPAERLKVIVDGLSREAAKSGGRLVTDEELLKTVVNLNECPAVICGSFDPQFLDLPQEILITVMREHQKYFSLVDQEGKLLPFFLAVINVDTERREEIRKGHERVLKARLADAAFFWRMDRKSKLEERMESLRNVLFQEKLGSYYDKTQRLLELLPAVAKMADSPELANDLQAAGRLCKCDLVTEMVKEFTDLQGVVGGLYGRAEGYPESVWRAVYEHYQPKSTNSPSPGTRAGALLALTDRLDTVCGCFSIGLIPTGSGDPLAVRRQGNGILKIILDQRMRVSLRRLMDLSLKTYMTDRDDIALELHKFFEGRLRFLLEEMGNSYDCMNAGLSPGFDDPLDAVERVRAFQDMRKAEDFVALALSFKRIQNILNQAGSFDSELNASMLSESAERALWENYLRILPEVQSAVREHDYVRALRVMASMRQSVDRFFNEVLVMAEDQAMKRNRLLLLRELARLFSAVGDISEIVREG